MEILAITLSPSTLQPGEIIIVAALLGSAAALSRRWSARPLRRTATVTTPSPVSLTTED